MERFFCQQKASWNQENCFMRQQRNSVRLLLVFAAIACLVTESRAQQRVFAKIEPNANSVTSTAETYDPVSGSFTRLTSSMTSGRQGHAAVVMRNGQIFFGGGYNGAYLSTVDIYDVASGTFSTSSRTMATARNMHTAVLLQDGRVFVAGGFTGSEYLSSCEIYDPSSDAFTTTSNSMTTTRRAHTATVLPSGKVLITGGYNGSYLGSAELFDPSAGTFASTTGTMVSARAGHSAVLLSDGKVLIVGGLNADGYVTKAEIFDPSTGNFTATSGEINVKRENFTATILDSGKVLIAGGYNGSYVNGAEVYDPSTGRFTAAGNLSVARSGHSATLLSGGKVLIAGGTNGAFLAGAELFDPSANAFTTVPGSMTIARNQPAATMLPNGRVLITGGQNASLLLFDVNLSESDNVAPNVVFTSDSSTGFVAYTGSGTVLAFSPKTGEILKRIETGGKPTFITPLSDGKTLAVVSVWENKIFLIDVPTLSLKSTYTFGNAVFGFGSILTLSPDGATGYISSTGTAEVIKFNVTTGTEQGRLTGLQAPAQLTVSKDGAILMVVDTSAEELVFANTSSMTNKTTFKLKDKVSTADLTIFNKAVLAPDGTTGIISCHDTLGSLGSAFIFRTATAEILDTETLGPSPGYTTVTPNGQNWLVLNDGAVSLIPTYDPGARQLLTTAQSGALSSANIAVSSDSRYAYYTSGTEDLVFQHDLITQGVVGQVSVKTGSNKGLEQASTVGLTPDGAALAAVSYISNNITLIKDITVLNGARFLTSSGLFCGLSLINLSNTPVTLMVSLFDNYGGLLSEDNLTNPMYIKLEPGAQVSQNITQMFNLDPSTDHAGWLSVTSDEPRIVGYLSTGQIEATWFGYYLKSMDGSPLMRDEVHEFIIPELVATTSGTAKFNAVNPNHAQQTYDLRHYANDGTLSGEKLGQIGYPTNRSEQGFTDLFTATGENKVLVAGGKTTSLTRSSSELYDVTTKSFSSTGSLVTGRWGHSATLLMNGKVLLAGGRNGTTGLNSAETYDVAAGTYAATADVMKAVRHRHTATVLPSGKVLLAGGQNATAVNDTAELYDPTTNNFSLTAASMTAPRDSHTATLLPTGKVLIAGGTNGDTVTNSAELFDPATGTFTRTGSMVAARVFHTATKLSSGKVLLAGGYNGSNLNTAEIFDPATGTFRATAGGMVASRQGHTATLLEDGRVLLAGGTDGSSTLTSAELYDPDTNSFTLVAGTMNAARSGHAAALISDTQVLIVGGTNPTDKELTSAEVFDSDTQSFTTTTGSLTESREGATATLLQSSGEGYVRASAKQGLIFTEYYGLKHDAAALNGIDVDNYSGVTRIYSPQFAIVSGFKTVLNLINANPDNDSTVTITLHAPDGHVLGTPVAVQINHNGKLQQELHNIFQLDPALANTTGWIEVNSSNDRLVGTVSFTNEDDIFLTSFALLARPQFNVVFPLAAEDGMYQTGIALLNTNDGAANVTVELWSTDGKLRQSASATLKPGERTALYLSDYFPGMGSYVQGNVRVHSNRPVFGIGLINDRSFNFIAAVPAIPMP
jgi:N-acetylneuraminic acid mutarotase